MTLDTPSNLRLRFIFSQDIGAPMHFSMRPDTRESSERVLCFAKPFKPNELSTDLVTEIAERDTQEGTGANNCMTPVSDRLFCLSDHLRKTKLASEVQALS